MAEQDRLAMVEDLIEYGTLTLICYRNRMGAMILPQDIPDGADAHLASVHGWFPVYECNLAELRVHVPEPYVSGLEP